MLSQLSYFPTWTPQRGVARYVCHSSAAVKSFLCTGRPSVRREGPDIRGMQGPGSYEAGSGKQEDMLAPVATRMGRKRHAHCSRQLFPKRFLLGMQAGELQLSPVTLGQSRADPKQACVPAPRASGHGASPRPRPPAGKLHATPGKACGIPGGRSFRHPLKKIGRAAPVGAWLPRKKTL